MAKIIKLLQEGNPILQHLKKRDKIRAERVIAAHKLKTSEASKKSKPL